MAYHSIILEKQSEIATICRRYNVQELSVFGSALGPDFSSGSDVDFLVEFAPGSQIGLLELGKFQEELEVLLQRKVDLVSKPGLKPLIRQSVLQQAELVYAG
jgi:hypothetical protein